MFLIFCYLSYSWDSYSVDFSEFVKYFFMMKTCQEIFVMIGMHKGSEENCSDICDICKIEYLQC